MTRQLLTTALSRRQLLVRGSALAVGGAALLAGCSGPSVPTPTASPTGSIRSQLDEAIKVIANGSDKLGVAIHDLRNGAVYGYQPDYASQSASMAKPMIVLMAERAARADGTTLTAEQVEQATAAITHSENDPADALYAFGGQGAAYTELARELQLPNTHADEAHLESWSWTWTTPSDQALLVQRLAEGSPAITDAERGFVWDLMGQVIDEHAWGVGAPRSATVKVHLKNGWVQFQSSDGLWAVNSMGQVDGDGRSYRIAMMTRTADFDTGRETLDALGRWVFDILGSGPIEPE
ncbi:MAG: serine hydrolase [Propionicimonas sp.]|uniref:serine hydrolase n=1 Tax=Propionicimonas sp. TaxID=1955623 RepID=UPI002B1F1430|nr:serine hydrolase [Propionicimonas sp.]MEA4943485.1 serine hydrolase [Propionicimonas sp.]MEA5055060.1 serine hydrolase [Propionicimonas sp.]